MLASALGYIAEHCLEKDKRYEASCLIFTKILMKRSIKAPKRGKWWVRLATDLKHLRLKKDVAKVIECALRDVQWVKTGDKNQLLKKKAEIDKQLKRKPKTKKK